jgi:hypothetical protein
MIPSIQSGAIRLEKGNKRSIKNINKSSIIERWEKLGDVKGIRLFPMVRVIITKFSNLMHIFT